jgi:glucose dehydrogenase
LYWAAGNPHPDTDGDERAGSNLYTNSDLAIDVKTGKMLWYYQFTPHDLHDWDANEPIVLVDAKWKGQDRKLLLHANRNGFLYVLDRTTGTTLDGDEDGEETELGQRNRRADLDSATASRQRNQLAGNGDLSRGARRHKLVRTAYNPATRCIT